MAFCASSRVGNGPSAVPATLAMKPLRVGVMVGFMAQYRVKIANTMPIKNPIKSPQRHPQHPESLLFWLLMSVALTASKRRVVRGSRSAAVLLFASAAGQARVNQRLADYAAPRVFFVVIALVFVAVFWFFHGFLSFLSCWVFSWWHFVQTAWYPSASRNIRAMYSSHPRKPLAGSTTGSIWSARISFCGTSREHVEHRWSLHLRPVFGLFPCATNARAMHSRRGPHFSVAPRKAEEMKERNRAAVHWPEL